MNIEHIAQVCHEANRAYCQTLGDGTQPAWQDAPDWQKRSAINGVKFHLENPAAGDAASHENWLAEKLKDGWKYGSVKNSELKEHPCFVPFTALPTEQQSKGALFRGVVHSLSGMLPKDEVQMDEAKLEVVSNKRLRRDIDSHIQTVKALPPSRERSICITKLQEAVMWLGMDLKRLNEPNPYPSSKDPTSTRIEPTADGLRL